MNSETTHTLPGTPTSTRRRVVLAAGAALPLAAAGLAAAQMDAVKQKADEMMHGGKKRPGDAVKRAGELGTFSMRASETMRTKASDASLKEFAKLEAEEQKTVAEIMSANFDLGSPEFSAEHRKKLDEMKSMSSGPELDEMYLSVQMDGHQKLLDLHEQLSASGSLTEAPTAASALAVCAIESHLAMLEMIRKQMG
ncbi:DUF4142 domain-containing protein [Phycisphaera mikurensis]|uniref:DUF4142 domain-containing protein n=1 Tax=Phycisphaera mikurensis (strain NBRC 102666 / KCTC 22515 / FYK2301M01) TaxID=1142394 RepID=I0IH44_PHYMF|nr:DUF4142 domain-containing protein [Phycisphaera mikurensis]MBB6440836.1 putative membrane protein [Phycisphaera mikurensis]BAM04582.1 hypothetical protein PSMK_24230 [Phycisphaera mikurensis NBRC 102666]